MLVCKKKEKNSWKWLSKEEDEIALPLWQLYVSGLTIVKLPYHKSRLFSNKFSALLQMLKKLFLNFVNFQKQFRLIGFSFENDEVFVFIYFLSFASI